MSSTLQEPVCQSIQILRDRLNKIQLKWDSIKPNDTSLNDGSFRDDWDGRWKTIRSTFREVDRLLDRSCRVKGRISNNPAILQFPPS